MAHNAGVNRSNTSRKPYKVAGLDFKHQYKATLFVGLFLSLGTITVLFRSDFYLNEGAQTFDLGIQEIVQMEEIEQTQQEKKPPPPPRPPVPVTVPDDVVMEDVELDLDASLDLNAEITDVPPPPPAPKMAEDETQELEIFVVVEQMPEMIGGAQKVYEYLEYPEIARQAGLEGLVVIQVVVNKEGIPEEPIAVRSGGAVLDKAAIDAVMKLRFIPGKQRGKAVKVRLAIPIRFRLRDATK